MTREELEEFFYNVIDHNTTAMPDVKRSVANTLANKAEAYADKVKKDLIGFVSYGEMMLMAEKRDQDVRYYDYYEGQKDLLKWLKEQLKTKV